MTELRPFTQIVKNKKLGRKANALELFSSRIPWSTLASTIPFKHGGRLRRFSRQDALATCMEIQPNPDGWKFVLTFDIDGGEGAEAWRDASICKPNIIVGLPGSNRVHFIYLLEIGVDMSNLKARKYFEAIQRAYLAALIPYGADIAYRGVSVHNPLHELYETSLLREEPYNLDELAIHADFHAPLPDSIKSLFNGKSTHEKEPKNVKVGNRNKSVFDAARHIAYRIGRVSTAQELLSTVTNKAHDFNNLLEHPLNEREVNGIIKSVVDWTTQHISGKKVIITCISEKSTKRLDAVLFRKNQAQKMKKIGKTVTEIAIYLGVTARSIWRYLQIETDTKKTLSGVREEKPKCNLKSSIKIFSHVVLRSTKKIISRPYMIKKNRIFLILSKKYKLFEKNK